MIPDKSNTLCFYPFYQLAMKVYAEDGSPVITPCCNSVREDDQEGLGEFTDESLTDIFHSPAMDKLRNDLKSGVKNPVCNACWRIEEQGLESFRIRSAPRLMDVHEQIKLIDNPRLDTLDMTSSLKCNLRCRMCGPGASHKIHSNEVKQFTQMGVIEEVDSLTGMSFVDLLPSHDFEHRNVQLKMMKDGKETLRHIRVSGGEPLYDKDFLDLLDKMSDHNPNMIIGIHTNATQFSTRVMRILNKFKYLDMTFSIDGFGKVYDFIRHPATWEQLQESINRFKREVTTNYEIKLNVVYQSANILNLNELIEFGISNNWFITLSELYPYERAASIRNLPSHIGEEVMRRLSQIDTTGYIHAHKLNDAITNIGILCGRLTQHGTSPERMLREIELFDAVKGQNYQNHLDPMLIEWIVNHSKQ